MPPARQMSDLFREVRPAWDEKAVAKAESKLASVDINSIDDLTEALQNQLNVRLQEAGLKAFTADTLDALKYRLGIQSETEDRRSEIAGDGQTDGDEQQWAEPNKDTAVGNEQECTKDLAYSPASKFTEKTTSRIFQVDREAPQQDSACDDTQGELFEGIPDLTSLLADLDREEHQDSEDHEDPWLKERAIANGVPLTRLEKPEHLAALVESIERLESMTVSKLRSEYEERGFAITEDQTSRAELAPLVRDVLIWEAMKATDLLQVCRVRGLSPREDQTHVELMELLAKSTWRASGVPVDRFASLSDARIVLDQVRAIDAGNVDALRAQSVKFGLPAATRSAEELHTHLKQFFIWSHLPVAELEKECQTLGVLLEARKETFTEGALKGELLRRLVLSIWGSTWVDVWKRLGSFELLEMVMRQVEHLQSLDISSIQLHYKEHAVPFDNGLDKQALIDRLRDLLIWRQMPMASLRAEGQAQAIQSLSGCADEEGERAELIKWLVLSSWSSTWEARGIPALRLGSLSRVETIMKKIDHWRSMQKDELRAEFKTMHIPFDSLLNTKDLLDRLRSIMIWRMLEIGELRQECSQNGICLHVEKPENKGSGQQEEWTAGSRASVEADDAPDEDFQSYDDLLAELDAEEHLDEDAAERRELIRRLVLELWGDTWASWGIPAHKLARLETISTLMEEVDRLRGMSISVLKAECQAKSVPYDHLMHKQAFIDRLKEWLVWRFLPIMELHQECRSHNVDVGTSCQREELIRRLLERSCFLVWQAQGVPVERLPSHAAASELVDRLEQIKSMDRRSLVDWYTSFGFSDEKDLDNKELATMLKNVTIWQTLPQAELRKECANHNLEVPEAWRSAFLVQRVIEDEDEQRQKLVHLLFTNQRLRAWETEDLPATRVGSIEAVIMLKQQLKRIDNMRLSELEAWYADTHLPKEKSLHRNEMSRLLRLVTVWDALPVDELLKECEKRQISTSDLVEAADEQELKQRLQVQLLLDERMAAWELRGFQARRIGNVESVIQMVQQYEHFKTLSILELQKTYQEVLLFEDTTSGRDEILRSLLIVLTWEMLPVTELRKDCQVRNLPISVDIKSGADTADDSERWELIRRLKVDLIIKLNRGWYEERGIPVSKLNPLEIADIAARFNEVDGMSVEDLVTWYEGTGLPKENGLERTELQKLLKKVTLWNMLSLPDLWHECEQNQIVVDKVSKSSSTEDQRNELGVHLLINERMGTWDAKGFQAHRLGNVDTVLQAIQQISHFEGMEDKELLETCSKAGLPSQRGVPREEVLEKLKKILIWELLPLVELRKDCQERNLPSQQGKAVERQESIRWLTQSTWNNTWALRGVPAERLGNLQVASSIVEEYDRLYTGVMYNDMVGKGMSFLKNEYKNLGMPYDPDLEKEEHIDRLRDLYVWQYLPITELRAECKIHETWTLVPGNADERPELIKRLVLTAWAQTWKVRGIPAKRLGSLDIAQTLIEQVDRLRSMSIIALRTECQTKGVKFDQHMDREHTWHRLKDLLVWRALPVAELQRECMDRGIAVSQNLLPARGPARGAVPRQGDVHGTLVKRLLDYTYLKKWQDQGIPLLEIDDTRKAMSILEEVDNMSEVAHRRWYRSSGFPDDADITMNELGILLKKVRVWQEMSLDKLQKQCSKSNLKLGTGREQKDKLINMLLANERMQAWQDKGFPVQRIGHVEGMIQLITAHKQADQMKLADLEQWYKSTGLPHEKGIQRDELIKLLKSVTLWNVLPLSELQKECVERNVSIDEASKAGDDEKQKEKLGVVLLLNARMDVWDAKGYQARRMGEEGKVMAFVQRLEEFRRMSDEELEKMYADIGLPRKDGMKREERLDAMKAILTWELLPLSELEKDCKERHLSIDQEESRRDQEKCVELLNRLRIDLIVTMTRDSLEKREIPVSRLGSLQAASVAGQFDHFESLSDEDLKKTFVDAGFPFENILERSQLMKTIKTMVVWEMLPFKELQKECLEFGLPIQTVDQGSSKHTINMSNASDQEKSNELAQRLRTDLCVKMNSSWYEQQGISLSQISTLKANQVFEEFEKFKEMSVVSLRKAHADLGMPIDYSMLKDDLLSRLREATLWKATPVDRLRSACETRGIPSSRLQGILDDDLPDQLFDMLMLRICESTFKNLQVPVEKFKSCRAASGVVEEWSNIDKSTEAELLVKYHDMGVSPQYLGWKEVKARLKTAAIWKQLTLKDLQEECRSHDFYGYNARDNKVTLTRRLAKALWPPKPNPKPKPKPPPPPPPPPPRPPAMSSFFKMSKYFQTLELPPSAGIDEVKKAYRKLALKYHPDKNVGAGQKLAAQAFREVAEAYEKLSEHLRTKPRFRQ